MLAALLPLDSSRRPISTKITWQDEGISSVHVRRRELINGNRMVRIRVVALPPDYQHYHKISSAVIEEWQKI